MLSLSPGAMDAVARQRGQAFALRLLARLRSEFPSLFDPLPVFVRATLLCNGLDRAESFGFSLEKTLGSFVALQCVTAPDFFVSEHVQPWLAQPGDESQRMARLLAEVPPEVWTAIKRGADPQAWFEPRRPDQQAARIALPVCLAFPELVQHVAEAALHGLFTAVPARGRCHGLTEEDDLRVFAAALAFYGDALDQRGGPAWAAPLFWQGASLPPARLVAELRLALLLDSGRLV